MTLKGEDLFRTSWGRELEVDSKDPVRVPQGNRISLRKTVGRCKGPDSGLS